MTSPYRLSTRESISSSHPLHWTQFWPDLQRVHRGKIEARQDLVLWLANLYHGAIRSGKPFGFCTIQIRLMDLRDWVRDYKPALEHFFETKQLGFRFNDQHQELTTLMPKRLSTRELGVLQIAVEGLTFKPPELPNDDAVVSKVYLQAGLNKKLLVQRCLATGRPELIPALTWLLAQGQTELNFYFKPSGKLKQRDTSVWPIPAIELWPSWLRKILFGAGIDLDSAYVQFLMHHLKSAFKNREPLMEVLFPDILRLLHDKEVFREELCIKVLQKPYDEYHRGVIKQVIMSLANGSRISPAVLTSGNGFSLVADIINEAAPNATLSDLTVIGNRLKRISDQFNSARKYACLDLLKKAPNRKNVKEVFSGYFTWERKARYALWEAVGRHGIMVHDGLDGVPAAYLNRVPELIETLGLQLTA